MKPLRSHLLGHTSAKHLGSLQTNVGTLATTAQTVLALALSDDDPGSTDSQFTYSAVVTNTGTLTATTVALQVTLDSSLTYVSAVGTGWTCSASGQVVTCTRASLTVGAAPTITITVTAGASAGITRSTGFVTASNAVGASDVEDTTINVNVNTTLAASLADSADPVLSTAAFSYTLDVTNTGLLAATTVSAAITLDSAVTFVSASGTGWSCGASGQVVTCTRSSLSVGAAPTITVNVTSGSATATHSSSVSVTAANVVSAATDTETTSCLLVTKDATSGIRVPNTGTEVTNLGEDACASLWRMQEASGTLADSVGSVTLTSGGTSEGYNAAVAGWTRKAVTLTNGVADYFSGTVPNINATPTLLLLYVAITTTPTAARTLVYYGGAKVNVTTSPFYEAKSGTADPVDGVSAIGTTVRPVMVQMDPTGGIVNVFTDQEKILASAGTLAGTTLFLGGVVQTAPGSQILMGWRWTGASAQKTQAQIKTMLTQRGWSPAWTPA